VTVLLTLTVGLLTAIAACLGAGVVAAVCVSWYHITSREGASGYFVVAMGLLGFVSGAVIGVVCARVVAARPSPTSRASARPSATRDASVPARGSSAPPCSGMFSRP